MSDSLQSLTRRGATCSELLTCVYNLKPIELEVFFHLARRENATLDEIAAAVKRDRSSTHRSLSKLVSANLAYKQVRTLKDGGYYHVYSAVEPSKIREQAKLRVKEIADGLQRLVDNFDRDFQKHLAERAV
jgi:predicted transcriptional regulator